MKQFILASLLIGSTIVSIAQEKTEKEPFKPSGKLWGYSFGDFAYKIHADELNRGSLQYSNIAQDYNSFDIRRIYLGYDYQISEKFASELILAYDGGTNLDAAGNRSILIKAANLRWKGIYKNADLVVGQMPTITYNQLEKIWGYRSIEKMIIDQHGVVKSSDLGVALQGKFSKNSTFGYNLFVGGGTGTKPENDKYKRIYSEIYGRFLENKLFVGINAEHEGGKSGDLSKDKVLLKFNTAYQTEKFTVGFEVFQQTQDNGVAYKKVVQSTTINDKVTIFGTSIFVKGVLKKDKLNFFARYDSYNPDTNFSTENVYLSSYSTNSEAFFTAGLDFTPIKNVHFMPNIWVNSYNSKVVNIKNDYDLAARATFYFTFGNR